jgi:hypothetical protein
MLGNLRNSCSKFYTRIHFPLFVGGYILTLLCSACVVGATAPNPMCSPVGFMHVHLNICCPTNGQVNTNETRIYRYNTDKFYISWSYVVPSVD